MGIFKKVFGSKEAPQTAAKALRKSRAQRVRPSALHHVAVELEMPFKGCVQIGNLSTSGVGLVAASAPGGP